MVLHTHCRTQGAAGNWCATAVVLLATLLLGGCSAGHYAHLIRGHYELLSRRVPIAELPRILEHGLALCDVFWVMHVDESGLVARPEGHTGYFPTERLGYPDIFAKPDPATLRLVPWHEDTALLLCDWHLPHDGGDVPISPRSVLSRVVERTQRRIELESERAMLQRAEESAHPVD